MITWPHADKEADDVQYGRRYSKVVGVLPIGVEGGALRPPLGGDLGADWRG